MSEYSDMQKKRTHTHTHTHTKCRCFACVQPPFLGVSPVRATTATITNKRASLCLSRRAEIPRGKPGPKPRGRALSS